MINIKVEDLNNNTISLKEDNDNLNIELKDIKDALVKEKDNANNLIISNTKYIEYFEDNKIIDEENQLKVNDIIEDLNLKITELKDDLSESNNSNEHLVIEVIYLSLYFVNLIFI